MLRYYVQQQKYIHDVSVIQIKKTLFIDILIFLKFYHNQQFHVNIACSIFNIFGCLLFVFEDDSVLCRLNGSAMLTLFKFFWPIFNLSIENWNCTQFRWTINLHGIFALLQNFMNSKFHEFKIAWKRNAFWCS